MRMALGLSWVVFFFCYNMISKTLLVLLLLIIIIL